jgi:predicted nucleic acid binding AN1-type Zn finger protein
MHITAYIFLATGIFVFGYLFYKIYRKYHERMTLANITRCSRCSDEIQMPLICEYCHKPFCKKHKHPLYHNCAEWKKLTPDYAVCSVLDCGKIIRNPRRCNYCNQFFCDKHSLPFNHNCENIEDWKKSNTKMGVTTISKDGKLFVKK